MQRALTSASNLFRRWLCPGSARLEKDLPDIKTPESEQGTRLANFMAHPEYDRRFLSPVEQDLLRIADQLHQRIFDTVGLSGSYTDQCEVQLSNDVITGRPDLLRAYSDWDASVIVDDKFGWSPVGSADLNLQLRCYAVLAPTSTSYAAISQPRLSFADRITIARYDSDAKDRAREQIVAILKYTEPEDAPLVPGEEQCRYCRARMICPALKEAITKELVVFEDLTPELSKTAMLGRIEARLAQATDEQAGALFAACALARLVSPALNDEIRRRISKGGMDGYTLSKEVNVRTIMNARRAISLLVLGGVFTREEVLEICGLEIGDVERGYRDKSGVSAKKAREEINRVLASVIEIDKRKPRIIPPK
jgi:PD-(D/E)XK nuclease superfamily